MRSVVTNYNQTNATANLSAQDVSNSFSCSAIANFSDAAAAGTLKFQASNDKNAAMVAFGQPIIPAHWVDIAGESVVVVAGATIIIPKFDICYQSIRLVWTRTAGAGTINVNLSILGF